MNPWKYKFNGNTTEDLSFNPTSLVGVGVGVNTGSIFGRIHISTTGKEVTAAANGTGSAALFLGDATSSNHMIFDADEIMVKNTNLTGGLLKLQEEDGSIQIGSDRVENVDAATIHLNTTIGSTTNNKNLTVYGNVDAKSKIKENGNDLLPTGSIIAFYGASVPAGWALCDGTNGTPNLSGRTIIGVGSNGENTYTYNTPGGSDGKTIVAGMIPNHTHTGNTTSGGAHNHSHTRYLADNDDNDDTHYSFGTGGGSDPQGASSAADISSTGSSHSHTISTNTCSGCGTTQLNVVSKHLVLRYIMKL
jgi:microcystin-dependent protein